MSAYLSKEKIQEIIATYGGGNGKNSGATEVQIALFTTRIQSMSDHLRDNRKDNSCKKALLTLVGKRKRLLTYLQNTNLAGYREILEKLNIRK
jgi:small subunit ribosomal protein S15